MFDSEEQKARVTQQLNMLLLFFHSSVVKLHTPDEKLRLEITSLIMSEYHHGYHWIQMEGDRHDFFLLLLCKERYKKRTTSCFSQ